MQPAGSLRLPRQANRRDDLVLHRASARPVLGRRTAGRSAFRHRSRLGRMEVMFLLCRKCGTLGDAVECSHFESIVMISATALVVIACSILFFCASVATASNFTPVKSAQPTVSALRQRLADEPKCWCMGSHPPPICTFATLCQSSGRLCVGSCD